MIRSLVFSGGGDYSDPWHGYTVSSEHLGELVRACGHDVEVTDRTDDALSALEDHPDLLVVNAGAGESPHSDDRRLAQAARDHVAVGGGLLVVHLSSGLFPGDDTWERLIGGRWIWNQSGHPHFSPFTVRIHDDPLVVGLNDFTIADESYARLRLSGTSRVLASHENDPDGERHPLFWVRDSAEPGHGRVAVDLLGHDGASFENDGHRTLIERALNWMLAEPPVDGGSVPIGVGASIPV